MNQKCIKVTSSFLILIAVTSIVLVHNCSASSFHGVITQSTTWTKQNSPYTLDGPTSIGEGVTVTVEPGVTVNLNGYYLQVNGTLIARGTVNEKIYFTNGQVIYTTSSPGGTTFEYTVTETLQTATTLTITRNTFTALDAGGSSTVTYNNIENLRAEGNSVVTNNQITKTCYVGGSAKISSNNIQARLIFTRGCTGEVSNNQISDGIYCDIGGGDVTITNNQITNINAYPLVFIAGAKATVTDNSIFGQNNPSCGISVGGSYHSAIQTEVTIERNQISGCETGISISNSWVTVKNNAVYNNDLGISIWLLSSYNRPPPGTNPVTIEKNSIAKNLAGIQYQPYELTATISYNNIQENSEYNFKLVDTTSDVTVANNYWGTTSTDEISQKIYDYNYDFNLGKVNFTPILKSIVAGAPNIPSNTPTMSPTVNPTIQPTTNPTITSTPITIPTQPTTDTQLEFNLVEIAILLTLIIIAILLAGLIVTLKQNRKK